MALTFGSGPFGPRGGHFDFAPPEHVRYWEPWPRRMRALFAGETLLDSRRGILLHQTGGFPAHYFPLEDLRPELLAADASVPADPPAWSVRVGERVAERAVTGSPLAATGQELLPGFVTIDYTAMLIGAAGDQPCGDVPTAPGRTDDPARGA